MKALNMTSYMGETRAWWVVLIVGILMVLAGFTYWFWPGAGYAIASQIFGWMLILAGIVQLCVSSGPNRPARSWGWWLAGGVIDIFVGFLLVRSILLSEIVFPYFLAFVFIFWGIEALVGGTQRGGRYWWLSIINGILLCIIGFLFLEAGYVQDMVMVSFLTAIAFIYWGFTIAMVSYEMRPVELPQAA